MKTDILPASDPSYPLVAGKLLEEMKMDQKKPQSFLLMAALAVGRIFSCRQARRYRKVSILCAFNRAG